MNPVRNAEEKRTLASFSASSAAWASSRALAASSSSCFFLAASAVFAASSAAAALFLASDARLEADVQEEQAERDRQRPSGEARE